MRCFTVLGPSQAGKTTLVEGLAMLEGRSAAVAFSDALSVHEFSYLGEPWAALDVAGGPDALGHAGGALAASDAAVLCVPADPAAAVLAAPYLRLVERSGVPCFIFINRIDQVQGRISGIVSALQGYASHHIVLRQWPIRAADGHVRGAVDLISERAFEYREGESSRLIEMPAEIHDREQLARAELLEQLADFDDHLMEELIEEHEPASEEVYAVLAAAHRENRVMAAYFGSASHHNGLTRLMKALRHEAPAVTAVGSRLGLEAPAAIAVASDFKRHVGKATLLRALDDTVQQRANLGGGLIGSLAAVDGSAIAGALAPGALAVAVKSDHLGGGHAFSAETATALPAWSRGRPPACARILLPARERDDVRLSTALARLAATYPGLSLAQSAEGGHQIVYLQSPLHLRRVIQRLREDFDVEVEEQPVPSAYRESIERPVEVQHRHRKQTGGAGQFAEVHLAVRPVARGAGFAFEEKVKGGTVPRNFIPAVEAGAREGLERGPLGFPVVDITVTLTDGKHHAVDSSDHAFRTAARNGLREALEQSVSVLLQPIERLRIHLPSVHTGPLMAQVGGLKGQILGAEAHPELPGWDIFSALLPGSAREELLQLLGSLTQGTAWLESEFDHYEELRGREAEQVLKERAQSN
jgi:elongation factor G